MVAIWNNRIQDGFHIAEKVYSLSGRCIIPKYELKVNVAYFAGSLAEKGNETIKYVC